MDYEEKLTEQQEREGREAEAQAKDADTTGEDDEKTIGLNSDFKLEPGYEEAVAADAEYVSKLRVVVNHPNGFDETEEEIEEESDIGEEDF